MSTQATIQIRIDAKTKRAAQKTLEEIGLDLSSAVKLFLRNVVLRQAIPLDLRTANGFTVAEEREMLREMEEALRFGKSYKTAKELHDAIEASPDED